MIIDSYHQKSTVNVKENCIKTLLVKHLVLKIVNTTFQKFLENKITTRNKSKSIIDFFFKFCNKTILMTKTYFVIFQYFIRITELFLKPHAFNKYYSEF